MDAIAQAEDETSSAFSISQEDIDDALQSKGTDSKYRIYRQLTHSGDKKENIALLKEIYGNGGGSYTFLDGGRGHITYRGKGIILDRNDSDQAVTLSWSKVEKRLRELIKADRYLNPKEKDHYARSMRWRARGKWQGSVLSKASGNCPLRISGTALPCGFLILSVTLTGTKKTCSMK